MNQKSNMLAVVALLCLGFGGMLSRSGQPEQSGAVEEAGQSPGTRVAASPTVTDSWDASSVVVVGAPTAEVDSERGEVVAPVSESAWPLSRDEAASVLRTAEWPEEWISEGVAVACGPGWNIIENIPAPSGESGCNPGKIGDNGNSLGFFQIQPRYWSERCGAGEAELLLPLPNAACALIIVRDNEKAGRPRWTYWSIRP